jgi:parvulin-like peptidyl-prolyl isomerase
MNKRAVLLFSAGSGLLTALLLISGCSKKKSPVVAVIDTEEILAEEITAPFAQEGLFFVSPEAELAEKKRLLDSLVELRLLVREAYRQKLNQDSLIKAFEEVERPLYLIDVLYFHEVRDKVRLPNSEVERFYRGLRQDRCLRRILVSGRETADSLLALARQGVPFDTLARQYSRDPFTASAGGDIGCWGWNKQLPLDLLEKILELEAGDLAGPFRGQDGWLVLQCYETRPAILPDRKVFEPAIRNLVEPSREERRSAQFVAEIRKELDFRIVDSTVRFVNRMQQELSRIRAPGRPEQMSIYLRTEELTPAERDMPLVVYKGGVVTAGQYLETQQGSMPMGRLILDTTERTKAMLFQLVFRDAMAGAARGRGLDKDPDFLKLWKQALERQMALLCKGRILAGVGVDSSQVLAYYRAHPEEFMEPAAVHLFEINRPSRENIQALKRSVKNKADLMITASQLTSRERLRQAKGELGWVEQHQFPELFAAASKMKPGEIAGPVALADGSYSLIYLEAKRAARKRGFAEVHGGLFEKLWLDAVDSAFAVWMEGQKKQIQVALYPEALEKTVDRTYYARLKEWQDKLKKGAS